jgi:hypothetical protein
MPDEYYVGKIVVPAGLNDEQAHHFAKITESFLEHYVHYLQHNIPPVVIIQSLIALISLMSVTQNIKKEDLVEYISKALDAAHTDETVWGFPLERGRMN